MTKSFNLANLSLPILLIVLPTTTNASDPIFSLLIYPPAYEQASMSPDGRYLAYTVDTGQQDILITARLEDLKPVRITRLPSPQSIGRFHWIGPNRLVFSTHTKIGSIAATNDTGNWQAIDANGGNPRQLFAVKYTGARYLFLDPLLDDPASLMMVAQTNERTELVRINTLTGQQQRLHHIDQTNCSYFLAGTTPRILTCTQQDPNSLGLITTQNIVQPDGSITALPAQPRIVRVNGAGILYAIDESPNGDRFGTLDPLTLRFQPLSTHPGQSISAIFQRAGAQTPFAVVTEPGKPVITHLSASHQDTVRYQALQSRLPGHLVIRDATPDGRNLLLEVSSDINPGQLYLADTVTGQARQILAKRPSINPDQMAPTQVLPFAGRAGNRLTAYLTLPPSVTRPPLIVLPHAGPWGIRDRWLFDAERQWLAAAGYAVLQVNYRGSAGYGQDFQDSVFGQWATGVVDDILDATHEATKSAQIDSQRICIYGSSFGAYAAVMTAAREPSLFRCVAGQSGPYSPEITLTQSDIAQTESGKRYLMRSMGSSPTQRLALDATKRADRLTMPVFLAAGANDPRTPVQHTLDMAQALTNHNKPPQTLVIPNQGHGFYGKGNQDFYAALLRFLDGQLKPTL